MQHEEIKVLTGDFVEQSEEKKTENADSDALIELLWKKKQRLQCLA